VNLTLTPNRCLTPAQKTTQRSKSLHALRWLMAAYLLFAICYLVSETRFSSLYKYLFTAKRVPWVESTGVNHLFEVAQPLQINPRCVNNAAFGGDERWAQGAIVPPDPRSLAQTPLGSVPSACVLVSPLYINLGLTRATHASAGRLTLYISMYVCIVYVHTNRCIYLYIYTCSRSRHSSSRSRCRAAMHASAGRLTLYIYMYKYI